LLQQLCLKASEAKVAMAEAKSISHAMVLGAGMGRRMRGLTDERPKPMVEVAGRPLVDHVLDRLHDAGVTDAVVNVHYKADVLERHVTQRTAPRIQISDERDALLDTGGGVVRALSRLGDAPFIIHNSDSIWRETGSSVLQALIDAWSPAEMDTLLLLADAQQALGYDGAGDFICDAAGRVSRRIATDADALVFAGVSVAHPRMFDDAPDGAFSLNRVWDSVIATGRAYGLMLEVQWMHVGTPESVAQADAAIAASSTT